MTWVGIVSCKNKTYMYMNIHNPQEHTYEQGLDGRQYCAIDPLSR